MISFSNRIMRDNIRYFVKSNMQYIPGALNRTQPSSNFATDKTPGISDDTTVKASLEKRKSTKLSALAPPYPRPSSSNSNSTQRMSQSTIKMLPTEKKLEREQRLQLRAENKSRFNEYLASLPSFNHPPHYNVECITDLDKANKKILLLTENEHVFGVDLEWPPTFIKGRPENKVSLVQICNSSEIILIQISRMKGVPSELQKFFENRKILKTGVNINSDGLKLYRDFGFLTNGLVELRDMVDAAQSPKLALTHLRSLRALTGMFLEQNMPKGKVRLSNWSKSELTPTQVKYAALDAYASYQLYVVLKGLQKISTPLSVKNLADNQPAKSDSNKKKMVVEEKLLPKRNALNNISTPTSTVTVIKKYSHLKID